MKDKVAGKPVKMPSEKGLTSRMPRVRNSARPLQNKGKAHTVSQAVRGQFGLSCDVGKYTDGTIDSSAFAQAMREEIDAARRQVVEDDARELERMRLGLAWYAEVPGHPRRGELLHVWADRQETGGAYQHLTQHRCERCGAFRMVTSRFGSLAKWFGLEGLDTKYAQDGRATSADPGCRAGSLDRVEGEPR